MKKTFRNIILTTSFLPSIVLAVETIPYTDQSISKIVDKISSWILGFAGAAAVLALIYSGLLFITASSSPERLEKAKKTLTYTIYGVIIIVLVYVILAFLSAAMDSIVGNIK